MMKTKEKKINLEDIWADDKLKRDRIASFLTTLINQNSKHGAVINLDSPWGTGKTFFLNRWYEELRKNSHICVKFSAWESDFIDAPLTAFISEIKKCLDETLPAKKLFLENEAKKLTNNLVRAGATFLLDMGKTFVTELAVKHIGEETIGKAKSIVKCITDAKEDDVEVNKWLEDASQEYWDKKSAMKNFRETLSSIMNAIADKKGHLPIYVIVDELDRCKPTYSIKVLEIIKHLFDVDNIAFVVATDTSQLIESIKAVYGQNFDSSTYLGRFFDMTYTLPKPAYPDFCQSLFKEHIWVYDDGTEPQMCLISEKQSIVKTFYEITLVFDLSLRETQQVFMRINAIIMSFTKAKDIFWHYLIMLVIVRLKYPNEYEGFKLGKMLPQEFSLFIKDELKGRYESSLDFNYALIYFSATVGRFIKTGKYPNKLARRDPFRKIDFCSNQADSSYLIAEATKDVVNRINHAIYSAQEHIRWVELTSRLLS